MKTHKIVGIHGLAGSSEIGFFKPLKDQMRSLNLDYDVSDYPGGTYNLFPIKDIWLDQLDTVIKNNKKPLVLFGHSLGTRTLLLYLEKNPIQVDTLILVSAAPNIPVIGRYAKQGRVASFFEQKIDTSLIRKSCKNIVQLHSLDDLTIPYFFGKHLSKELGSRFYTYSNKGHFSNPIVYMEVLGHILNSLS